MRARATQSRTLHFLIYIITYYQDPKCNPIRTSFHKQLSSQNMQSITILFALVVALSTYSTPSRCADLDIDFCAGRGIWSGTCTATIDGKVQNVTYWNCEEQIPIKGIYTETCYVEDGNTEKGNFSSWEVTENDRGYVLNFYNKTACARENLYDVLGYRPVPKRTFRREFTARISLHGNFFVANGFRRKETWVHAW